MTNTRAQDTPSRLAVCGIGASAGGVEALQHFFRDLPADLGLAYIVVVHLSPDHESELPAIIARWTPMPVVQVTDQNRQHLRPDHVYVIAPNRKLEITDSVVSASPFTQPRGHRTAIDLFFRSLAVSHGDGFAVILSGAGSDGAVGAKAMKERGGLVLVQDPFEAAHGSMPRAAIATGVADVVLPIAELVGRLVELVRNKARISAAARTPDAAEPIPEDEQNALKKVLDVVRTGTGHDFSGYKRGTVLRRVSRRMQLSDHHTIRAYLRFLRSNTSEVRALLDDLLISVTTFFRDADAWESLQRDVVALVVAQASDDTPIRVWVPGCATGEEAYTLAMLFDEELARQQVRHELIVFATDMDQAALAVAREGVYPKAVEEDVSEARLDRYFRHDGELYRVLPDIRDRLVFAPHNLLRDPPFGRLQLIPCRNVLIYLDRPLQDHAMRIFRYACRDDGFLFLGQSETADSELFTPLDTRHRIFRALPGVNERRAPLFQTPGPQGRSFRSRAADRPLEQATASQLHVGALEELAPPTVLLDERWNVLHLSPSAARFFQQGGGPPSTRVTELVRAELRDALHALLLRAAGSGDAHVSRLIPVPFDGAARGVALVVQPRIKTQHVLLTFLDTGGASDAAAALSLDAAPGSASLKATLHEAQQRIDTMREDAVAKTEELRAANEELLSLNEEFRSTTEELETSREELQSTNEELQTINEELKLRLEQVSRGRSDLENLMLATNVATLFLSLDLRITRYTRQLEEIFTIKPRDLERPIGDLRHTLAYTQLEDDARQVLERLSPIERNTTSRVGRAYIVRLSPYQTADDHVVDGVVITFVDVTALKAAEDALRDSERQLALELRTMRRLHEMTLHVATAPHLSDALEQLVSTAVDLHGADQGHVQLYDRDAQRLQIVAERGCPSAFLERSESIESEGLAAMRQPRSQGLTQIADVMTENDDVTRDLAEHGGYRAIQSSPLVSRDGEPLGVLSVHFRAPHQFTERDTQLGALLGRQAGDLLEARMRRLEVSASRHETSEVRDLLGRLVTIQEGERRRIARDIHDQLGQSMTALRMQLEALHLRSERHVELSADVSRVDRLAQELDENIDFLTWQLRPAALDRLGLSPAVADLVRGWSERFQIAADYHAYSPSAAPLTPETSVNIYRIVQEALHNVHKHARASHVSVMLSVRDSHLSVVIEDDGRGFDPGIARAPHDGSLGLVGMRERAILIGGEFTIESSPGNGTAIFVRVPVAPTR